MGPTLPLESTCIGELEDIIMLLLFCVVAVIVNVEGLATEMGLR